MQTKVIVGVTVAAGTLTVTGFLYLYKKKLDATPPTRWKKVGEIIGINFFPIKSCAPIEKNSFDCQELGLEAENIRDRSFMVITTGGNRVSAQIHPKLFLIKPNIVSGKLILSAPTMPDMEVNVAKLQKTEKMSTTDVWHQKVNVIDAGDAVADWISQFILGLNEGLRLVFYPDSQFSYLLTKLNARELHDVNNYMLVNQASVDEINTHLDHPVKPLQFRPNFVVKGPNVYEEDKWKWIRIGNDAVFRNIRPCSRCSVITIDPETAIRNTDRQPLKTLTKLRSIIPNEGPVMGTYLELRRIGKVSVGDAVYVEDE